MTTVNKNVYFNILDSIGDKFNNTYHSSIKMKPKDVTNDCSAKYNEESNKKDPKFKIADHVRILNYKNIFAKAIHLIGVKKSLLLKK